MATRAESLIRQFCTARENEIRDEMKRRRDAVPVKIRIRDLPARLRRLVQRRRQLKIELDRIDAQLTQAEISTYQITATTVPFHKREHVLKALVQQQVNRLEAIDRIRNQAYIGVMGAKPADARAIVEAVRADLAKV